MSVSVAPVPPLSEVALTARCCRYAGQQFTSFSGRELATIRKRAGRNQAELVRQVGHSLLLAEQAPGLAVRRCEDDFRRNGDSDSAGFPQVRTRAEGGGLRRLGGLSSARPGPPGLARGQEMGQTQSHLRGENPGRHGLPEQERARQTALQVPRREVHLANNAGWARTDRGRAGRSGERSGPNLGTGRKLTGISNHPPNRRAALSSFRPEFGPGAYFVGKITAPTVAPPLPPMNDLPFPVVTSLGAVAVPPFSVAVTTPKPGMFSKAELAVGTESAKANTVNFFICNPP